MLVSFSVANFLSFKDPQTINFEPEPLKELKDQLHTPYLFDVDARLLKSIALYGHNSHGKSNFLRAYSFFVEFIFNSFSLTRKEEPIAVENFRLNISSIGQPSYFECVFYLKQVKYRYGFKVNTETVLEEWLYYSEPKIRENFLFHRVDKEYRLSKTWNKESNNRIDKTLSFIKADSLLISVLIAQENIPRIDKIASWLRGNIIVHDINQDEHFFRAITILTQVHYRNIINALIQRADLGFVTILERIDSNLNKRLSLEKEFLKLYYSNEIKNFELYTTHTVYDEKYMRIKTLQFDFLKNESAGTKKFLIIACYLAFALKEGQLVLIDELDSSFHSLLLKVIVETFNDSKVNSKGSQMIFTTHNTVLLNKVLRRDQIVFVEKNEHGESYLRKLHSSDKPIRIDTPIEKEYMKGKLGGVSNNLRDGRSPELGLE